MRSVGSSEASYKLFAFPIAECQPPVQILRLHLEDEQHVVFVGGQEDNVVDQGRETELTAFFRNNAQKKQAEGNDFDPQSMPMYVDMPNHYTFRNKEWHVRQRGLSIGRVHNVSPLAGDVFYLRMLLHNAHCRGKTSFDDLKSLGGVVYDTFQAVCRELGLLNDDKEWELVLTQAAGTDMCPQIRALYVIILMFCQPADPRKLFDDFWDGWTDDFKRKGHSRGVTYTEDQLRTMVRLDLQVRLLAHEKDLQDFDLDPMTDEERLSVQGLVNTEETMIREELDFDLPELQNNVQTSIASFTEEQREIFESVMTAVTQKVPMMLFISARGGCGKTYLLNTILSAVRSLEPGGCIALATATTGLFYLLF